MKTSFEIRSKIAELKAAYRALFDGINEENKADTEAKAETVMAEIDSLETRAANFEKIEASDAAFETRAKAKRPTVEATVISAGADEGDSDMDAYRSFLKGETRALSTASGTIPKTVQAEVKHAVGNYGDVLPSLNIIYSDTGESYEVEYSDDLTNSGFYLSELGNAVTATDLPLTNKTLGAWDIITGTFTVSNKMIRDSGVDIVSFVNTKASDRLARAVEREVLVGDGTTGKAEGAFTAANVAVTTASNVTVTAGELFALQGSIASGLRANSKWYMHSQTLTLIRSLNDSTGRPLLQEGLNSDVPYSLAGKPVIVSDAISAPAANTVVIGYGDLGEAMTARLVGPSFTMDVFTDSAYSARLLTGFQGHVSFDSKLTNGSAFKALKFKA